MRTDFLTRDGLTVHPAYAGALSRAGLDTLEALLATPGAEDLHKAGLAGWRQRLRLELPGRDGGPGVTCYLKRYTRPPLGEQWDNKLAGAPDCAAVEWRWLTELDRLGVPGPVPVCYGARRRGVLEEASVVVTAAVPGEALERWVPKQLGPGGALADRRTKRRLLTAVARLVAGLHRHRLIHRDLYLAHIFLDPATLDAPPEPSPHSPPDMPPTLTLIDLQRMIRPRLRWTRWVVKDLAALHYSTPADAASTADRVRWLRHYLGVDTLGPADKRLLRAVARKARRIARHDKKRRARLG